MITIKELREIKGDTVEQVAGAIGVTVRRYRKYEEFRKPITCIDAYKIARHFQVNMDCIQWQKEQRAADVDLLQITESIRKQNIRAKLVQYGLIASILLNILLSLCIWLK